MLALAVVSEGAADHIRTNYLIKFLEWVCTAIKDNSLRVRNAALFALGQMSEHLQVSCKQFFIYTCGEFLFIPAVGDLAIEACSYDLVIY